jgi:integrase
MATRQQQSTEQHRASATRTKSGVEFDPLADHWRYQDGVENVSIDFSRFSGLSQNLVENARLVLKWYAENCAPKTIVSYYGRLRHLDRVIATKGICLNVIEAEDIINYRGTLDASTEWYLAAISSFLKKWYSMGYPGVSESTNLLLKRMRLKGMAKGVAVLTMDLQNGPFTQIEVEGLQAALNSSYAKGSVDTANYMLAWLYMLLGQRSVQYACLKVCDVRVEMGETGERTYSLLMPSAKRPGIEARERLVSRPLVEQFGVALHEYAEQVRQNFKELIPDVEQAPLFPSTTGRKGSTGYEHHATAAMIGRHLKQVLERLSVQSERTGKPVNVSAYRFRRTLGTRAAEEGHGPLVIAGLLDHTDTQNVGVYIASSPAIIERIDRAVALELAPLAQAFAGIIKDDLQSSGSTARGIIDLRIDRSGKAMGECGKRGFCSFSAPIACYTCGNFEAWVDGPHEAVLGHLIERRDRLLKSADKRIASINDRTILAVAQVVKRCGEMKAQSRSSIDG